MRLVSRYCLLVAVCGVANLAAEESPIPQATQNAAKRAITAAALRGHIRYLADDLLEGRGPGTRGDARRDNTISPTLNPHLAAKPLAGHHE